MQPAVKICPFLTDIIYDRSPDWSQRVQTRFYIYPIHPSCTYLETPSVSASLYWVLICFVHRNYQLTAHIINTVCLSDLKLNAEQRYILSQIPKTYLDSPLHADCHPDAHACRLMLALMCHECGDAIDTDEWETDHWNVNQDYIDYL